MREKTGWGGGCKGSLRWGLAVLSAPSPRVARLGFFRRQRQWQEAESLGLGLGYNFREIPPKRTLEWSVERIISCLRSSCCRPPSCCFLEIHVGCRMEPTTFWWFPSRVRDPMLGLSVPSSGPSFSPRPKMTLNAVVRTWVGCEP